MRKERGFLAARAAADLHNDIARICFIFRQKKLCDIRFKRLHFLCGGLTLLLCHEPEFGICFRAPDQFIGICDLLPAEVIAAVRLDDRSELFIFPHPIRELRGIGVTRLKALCDFLISLLRFPKLILDLQNDLPLIWLYLIIIL